MFTAGLSVNFPQQLYVQYGAKISEQFNIKLKNTSDQAKKKFKQRSKGLYINVYIYS